jgi:hypothetical protein
MIELDTQLAGTNTSAECDHPLQSSFVRIAVETDTATGNSTNALDGGGLEHKEARTGLRKHAQMHEVPITGATIARAVLAHWRNNNSVCEIKIGDSQRRKQSISRCHDGNSCLEQQRA